MRVCQKCGTYYADAGLAFCLADGTPLVQLEPTSELWGEGTRFVEEKENARRRRERRLKWRRVLVTTMTMLVTTLVVCVVVVNSIIYLKPRPEAEASTPAAEPASTPTVATVKAQITTESPTPTPTPECDAADKSRERETIIKKFGDKWQENIKGERDKIIARHTPDGVANVNRRVGVATVEATLGEIKYEVRFPKACTASVTARYEWQVKIFHATPTGQDLKEVSDPEKKTFDCVKVGAAWRCR